MTTVTDHQINDLITRHEVHEYHPGAILEFARALLDLAAPAQGAEPVAVVESVDPARVLWYVDFPNLAAKVKPGDKLYAGPAPKAGDELAAVRAAMASYYAALDNRQHGDVAAHSAIMAIEDALGMRWGDHSAAAPAAPKEGDRT